MKKIILFTLLLSSYAFASDNSSQENFETHPIFKNYTTQQMNQILSQ